MTVTEMFTQLDMASYATTEGLITADYMVLAVDTASAGATEIPTSPSAGSYTVVQLGTKSVDASLNAEKQTSAYIRAGKSTTKTGVQRTFKVDADRYVGDTFQDFCLSHAIKYAVGQACVIPYVYFDIATGKGESGLVSVIVETDGSGGSEENSGISISLEKSGPAPVEFTYNVPHSSGSGG